jgi:hypothetical protein
MMGIEGIITQRGEFHASQNTNNLRVVIKLFHLEGFMAPR